MLASTATTQLVNASAAPFPIWQVIPWLISGAALLLAYHVYRRNRHPVIRTSKPLVYAQRGFRTGDSNPRETAGVKFDLSCLGADVFDLRAFLEITYEGQVLVGPNKGESFESTFKENFFLENFEKLPNPIKNGQCIELEATVGCLTRIWAMNQKSCDGVKMKRKRIDIAILASGGRSLKRMRVTKGIAKIFDIAEASYENIDEVMAKRDTGG